MIQPQTEDKTLSVNQDKAELNSFPEALDPSEASSELVYVEDIPQEAVKEAATAVVEDPENKKELVITPTQPPKSYSKTNQLVTEATVNISTTVAQNFLSQAPMLACAAGQSFLSGSMAGVAGGIDYARSNNKKRAIARVLPGVGLALIPGVGIPLAIGIGMASNYTADKLYSKAEKRDRNIKLTDYWPSEFEFSKVKESLEKSVKLYTEIVDEYFDRAPQYHEKSQEVIELIQWLLRSLTKLRETILTEWHWKKMSTSTFDKNIKELLKGLNISDTEIREICNVIQEGGNNFNNIVDSSPERKAQKNENLDNKMKGLKENASYLESFRPVIKECLTNAMKYLSDEKSKLK